MNIALTTNYIAVEIATKRETEKAELLTITYMHKQFDDRAMTMDVWSPKSAIVRSGKDITGFAAWMLNKIEAELYKRN